MIQQTFKLGPVPRRIACDPIYVPKLNKTIEFVIGLPEDRDVILDYYKVVAQPLKPVDKASKLTPEQFREYYSKQVEEWLSGPYTILAHCNLEICGLITGTIRLLNGQKRSLKFEEDYGQKLLQYNAPNEPVRLLTCFFTEIQSFMPNFLPDDCKEYMRLHGLVLSPNVQGAGLAVKLLKEVLNLAFEDGVKWVTSTSTSPNSVHISLKFGMRRMFEYKYKNFKCNGIPVFGHTLHDGSKELQLLVGNLEEMKSLFIDNERKIRANL